MEIVGKKVSIKKDEKIEKNENNYIKNLINNIEQRQQSITSTQKP